MDARRLITPLAALLLVALLAGALVYGTGTYYEWTAPDHDEYERTVITTYDANGTELASVEVRIADTPRKRYLGLSTTDSLGPDEGMLFVHPEEGERGYVMRDMTFPIDIVFVDADERVTAIHHAAVPDGDSPTYSGRGKWVLEVPSGWTNATGLAAGDRVAIPPEARNASGGWL